MRTLAYSELVRRADELQVEEQLRLAAYLLERARQMIAATLCFWR